MKKEILEGIECKVCKNKDENKFKEKFTKDNLTVVQCQNCSFVFLPPFFRKNISYHDYKDEKVLQQVRLGNNWAKIQRNLLRFKLIKKYKKDGKLFDLGAGWGHFLYTARLLGYDISGVEVSDLPNLYCNQDLNLNVEHKDFFDIDLKESYYDIITMWDVLEHIDDSDKALERCAKMLKTGGFLVIQVPQVDSFISKIRKDKWNMLGIEHVNYFSKNTIKILLEKHGFEIKTIKSSFELKLFLLYTVLPWIKKFKKKKPDETIESIEAERQESFNKTTNKPMWLLKMIILAHNIVYKTLSVLKIGEEMMVVAEKTRK